MPNGQWEFPESVIVNRAMIDALVGLLIENGVIEVDQLGDRFRELLKKAVESEEKKSASHPEKVAT